MTSAIDQRTPHHLGRAREQAFVARRRAQEMGRTVASLRLDAAMAWYPEQTSGWDGMPFEAWRAAGEGRWWHDLVGAGSPAVTDWLAPWLDLEYVRGHPEEWVSFWTRDVDRGRMPREWIRWAMTEVQALKKVTDGTPVDNQIATYLVDFDVFVTADRGFAACIEALREYAPQPLAATTVIRGGASAADDLLQLIAAG